MAAATAVRHGTARHGTLHRHGDVLFKANIYPSVTRVRRCYFCRFSPFKCEKEGKGERERGCRESLSQSGRSSLSLFFHSCQHFSTGAVTNDAAFCTHSAAFASSAAFCCDYDESSGGSRSTTTTAALDDANDSASFSFSTTTTTSTSSLPFLLALTYYRLLRVYYDY